MCATVLSPVCHEPCKLLLPLRCEWVTVCLPWIWVLAADAVMQGRIAEFDIKIGATWFDTGATVGFCMTSGLPNYPGITEFAE